MSNNVSDNKQTEEVDQEIIDLVVARLKTMPQDATLKIGGGEDLTLDEVIEDVREQNDIGRAVVEEQMGYLLSLKDLLADEAG